MRKSYTGAINVPVRIGSVRQWPYGVNDHTHTGLFVVKLLRSVKAEPGVGLNCTRCLEIDAWPRLSLRTALI